MPIAAAATEYSIDDHFTGRAPTVREIYDQIVRAAQQFGTVREEPKKTSIHLANKTAFAGIATRKDALILTLKSAADIESPRVFKREQASTHRWHLEVRLDDPGQVDDELTVWIERAFMLAG